MSGKMDTGLWRSGKSAKRGDAALVVAQDVLARAGDGQFVQQFEKRGTQFFQQVFGFALAGLFLRPDGERLLRGGERVLQAADADGILECGVLAFGEEVNLVAQVAQVVVDRRGGEQEDFGFDAALDDVVHQPLVAALADEVAFLVALAGGVVAEVVRFVNDDEIEVAPVESREVDVAGFAAVAAQDRCGKARRSGSGRR